MFVFLGRNHLQNGLHVQYLRQARAVGVAVQSRDAGHEVVARAARLGRNHLVPVQAHDVFHRLHGKCLGGARVFGHQHDVQACGGLATDDGGQVQHRDDLAAQVDHAQRVCRGAHDGGNGWHGHDLADLEHVDAEQLGLAQRVVGAQAKQQQFKLVGTGEVGALVDFFLNGFHRRPLSRRNLRLQILEAESFCYTSIFFGVNHGLTE